ncbi:MAG: carboxypeptidase-like regulatory domain-containing protein, partial [Bacteroidota bacterium]
MKYIKRAICWVATIFMLSTASAQSDTVSIWVNGTCGMCMDRIEEAAMQTLGVTSASWDEYTRMLTVTTDADFVENNLHYAVTGVGHDTKKFAASNETYDDLYACCKYRTLRELDEEKAASPSQANADESETTSNTSQSPGTVSIWVNGTCGMCMDRIEEAAMQTLGVTSASWDEYTRMLTVTTDADFVENNLHYAVTGVGHDTKKFAASNETYDDLYACCKYRELRTLQDEAVYEKDERLHDDVHGIIYEWTGKKMNRKSPLVGANVYWLGGTQGTTTDESGKFSLDRSADTDLLVITYVGYNSDTIDFTGEYAAEIVLSDAVTLQDIEVVYKRKTTEISFIDPIKVQQISSKELTKAACCNLSESFETNPSVDVSFTDAVTGARQIQMLGLAGPYVQITRELIPDVRALASVQGLTYTPGPWIESIQLAKGVGSVSNGFESMTGQINVELKKPEESEPFFLNLYQNAMGRSEINTNFRFKLNDQWSTGFLLHGGRLQQSNDVNQDGFLDSPLYHSFIGMNRWHYRGKNNWEGQAGVKVFINDNESGQVEAAHNDPWLSGGTTHRYEAWAKVSRVFANRPGESFGSQWSVVDHEQQSQFGNNQYHARQRSFYGNLLYQGIIGTTLHQYKAGVSWMFDGVTET